MLAQLGRFVAEMNASNSLNAKKEVLARHPELKPLLRYVYDPFSKYGVSSANVKKQGAAVAAKRQKLDAEDEPAGDLFALLDGLKAQRWTGHAAIRAVQQFVSANAEHAALIYAVLDKDLKIGVQPTTINAVWPDLIPQFSVVLANDYAEVASAVDFADAWYCSRKLDGCRCVVMIDAQGEPRFYSRAGNEFTTLGAASADVRALNLRSAVLDSEACVLNDDGSENFARCVGDIKRKNYTIPQPKLYVFDLIALDDFQAGAGAESYAQRQARLTEAFAQRQARQARLTEALRGYAGARLCQLEQTRIVDAAQLAAESDRAAAAGWEGLILRKDVPYAAKRSADTLKVKRFLEAEFTVLGVEMGSKQMLRDGRKQAVETLASVVVQFEGCQVNVGSGFTDEERIRVHADPSCIIGKQITVQYFEATKNKKGGRSMRFPTKKHIWWQPRDV